MSRIAFRIAFRISFVLTVAMAVALTPAPVRQYYAYPFAAALAWVGYRFVRSFKKAGSW